MENYPFLCYYIRMVKTASIYASFLLIIGLMSPVVSLQAAEMGQNSIDFKAGDVGILPISPLYFLKEMRRDLMRFFTTDPVSEALLELQITNEKAGELKKVQEYRPDDIREITKAIENYKDSQKRLSAKLEEIKKLPEGRASDKLVEELASKAVSHERFLRSFEDRYIHQEKLKQLTESAKEELGKTTQIISKTASTRKLVRAVRETLISTTTPVALDDATKQEIIKSVINNLEEGAPENSKGKFIELRNELISTSTIGTSTIATSTIDIATSTITTSTMLGTSTESIIPSPLSL